MRGEIEAAAGFGVYSVSAGTGGTGVRGDAVGDGRVFGVTRYHATATGAGVAGQSDADIDVLGTWPHFGVYGSTSGTTGRAAAVSGLTENADAWAGFFFGKVGAKGGFVGPKMGTLVDHPADPANRSLRHAAVTAPEFKNIYDGVVMTDGAGRVTVDLPPYFEALNGDVRYQLTVIGARAQAFVSREVSDNSFEITTDQPRTRVCWQVTGVRRDA